MVFLLQGITDKAVEGTWTTMKGTNITYQKWDTGEPSNSNNQDYAVFWMPANAPGWQTKIAKAWDDVGDDEQVGIFCEINSCPAGNVFQHKII